MNAHAHVKAKSSAREALRDAIATRDQAAARVRETAAILARSERNAASARWALDRLGDVDAEILARATALARKAAEAGGDKPEIGTPAHLEEKRHRRDVARQELAAAEAARSQLTKEHAAAQGEHERRVNNVAKAADAVIAEMSLLTWGRYVQAIEPARAAWDDLTVICGMEVQNGPRWVDRTRLPGLAPGLAEAVGRGFGHRDESPPGESGASRRSAAWEDFRRRLRESADAEI
jgi:hypothetical protein